MVRPRTVRDALEGRLSGNQIDELLEGLESDSPVIRAAALVAAYAFLRKHDTGDRLVEELSNKLDAILRRHRSKESRPELQLSKTGPKRERSADRPDQKEKHEQARKRSVVPEGCELVGWEEVPVTEPYGWGYRVRVVKVPVVSWRPVG